MFGETVGLRGGEVEGVGGEEFGGGGGEQFGEAKEGGVFARGRGRGEHEGRGAGALGDCGDELGEVGGHFRNDQ